MSAPFANCYEDDARAGAYAKLEFARTYYLAYRDLPALFRRHVRGTAALDFGCGTGRSTRFLRRHGFHAIGVDISQQMIAKALELDPGGDYRLVPGDDFSQLPPRSYDLVLSAFTFDNIPAEAKPRLFAGLRALLQPAGKLISVVSAPEIYWHEWASFSTEGFAAQNRRARSGDVVRIIVTDHGDRRPVEDILCTDASYRDLYRAAGLEVVESLSPLATGDEAEAWVSETSVAPWTVYVLQPGR